MQVEKQRVLLVDDDEALLGLGHAMLTRLGYDVVACTRSSDALEAFMAAPKSFDLVVTDYTMPSLTGMQLVVACRHLRPKRRVVADHRSFCASGSPSVATATSHESCTASAFAASRTASCSASPSRASP